jgi:hypothetical protein
LIKLNEFIPIITDSLGPSSMQVLTARDVMAVIVSVMGQYERGLTEFDELIRITTEQIGPSNPNVLMMKSNYMSIEIASGATRDRTEELNVIIDTCISAVGRRSGQILRTRYRLASHLFSLNRDVEALY